MAVGIDPGFQVSTPFSKRIVRSVYVRPVKNFWTGEFVRSVYLQNVSTFGGELGNEFLW